MIPYWILFLVYAVGAVQYGPRRERMYQSWLFNLAAIATAFMIGLRFEVGGDWSSYLAIFERIYFLSWSGALVVTEPGYAFANRIAATFDTDIWLTNLICGTIFMIGLGRLCSRQPNPWLAMTVAVPYLVVVVSMGYTRQATAIGIVMFAVADIDRRSFLATLLIAGSAALMHKTAALMLPVLAVPLMRRNWLYGLLGAISFTAVYYYVLVVSVDQFLYIYVERSYDSQGALVRVSMNALAGLFMIIYRDRLGFRPLERSFWLSCAILSFLALVSLAVLSSSAGVDRLALFLLPLQIVVFSRLAFLYSRTARPNIQVLAATIAFLALVQGVWLNFATHAEYWLPYRTVIGQDDNDLGD